MRREFKFSNSHVGLSRFAWLTFMTFMTWPLTLKGVWDWAARLLGNLWCSNIQAWRPGRIDETTASCPAMSTLWPSQVDNLLHNAVTRVFCAALQWSKDPWRHADDADEPYGNIWNLSDLPPICTYLHLFDTVGYIYRWIEYNIVK